METLIARFSLSINSIPIGCVRYIYIRPALTVWQEPEGRKETRRIDENYSFGNCCVIMQPFISARVAQETIITITERGEGLMMEKKKAGVMCMRVEKKKK